MDGSGLGAYVVVVGDPRGELARTTLQAACAGEVDAVACDDVYAAVVHLAGAAGRRVLVVGGIKELTREHNFFFRIATARAVACCCLLDPTGPVERKSLHATLEAGVKFLDTVADIRRVLKEWLATPPPHASREATPSERRRGATADTSYEELRATEAELSALLG
jgi:hypothetical protein